MAQIQPYVGIDISKDRLDIHIHPTGEAFSLTYDRAGLRALLRRPELTRAVIGCEATGGYEERLLVALSEAGRPALCLHPADIRAFARLKGRRAKPVPDVIGEPTGSTPAPSPRLCPSPPPRAHRSGAPRNRANSGSC